ncbi:LysR family transcriptional regulator [Agromyces endophyticus]|uniref:LysR family transcriptional regulator n=1 Tax=Agromyces sp. H17E-10 TaxID=2932244 RepID=UPI001FD579EA|nr:LysR family transcriptional regulator [Agromyces sp. H17E-10]UOQ90303.1 LysR family transcriptional regulator [Agromyces sp. H17E-10]
MNVTLLVRYVAVAEELHFPRAAKALGIPLASLYSSIEKLESEVGTQLVVRDGANTRLTKAGTLFLETARAEIAAAPPPPPAKPVVPAGGKAKASKGKGRAPIVKGQPKPYKKRQSR